MRRSSGCTAEDAFAQGAGVYRRIREEEARVREAFLSLDEPSEAQGRNKAGRVRALRRCPVHAHYPLLVGKAFPFVEPEKLLELCRMGRLYAEHLLALDRTLDLGERANPLDLFLSSLQQAESLLGLYGWFSPGHPFWEEFWERASRTWKAVLLERIRHGHRLEKYPWEEYETTARDKTAVLGMFVLAPTYLSGSEDLRQGLSRSIDEHHKGLVLLDDLQDWREDYTRGQYSYPLTRVLLENSLDDLVQRGPRPTLAVVGRLLYGTGVAEEQLCLAEACFRRAGEGLDDGVLPDWIAVNRRYQNLCASLRDRVGRFRVRWDRRRRGMVVGGAEKFERERPMGRVGPFALLIQDGVSEASVQAVRQGLEVCLPLIRTPEAIHVALGRWDGMPAHFYLVDGKGIWVGIQVSSSEDGADSTSGRPLETETALACVRAQRVLCLGREGTLLETYFVAGLVLCACLAVRGRSDPWRPLALGVLEWQWCQKNEWLLWEMLKKRVETRRSSLSAAQGVSDPFSEFGPPAPRGAVLYLSFRLFEEASVNAVVTQPRWMLERWKTSEIRSALGWFGARSGGEDG